MSLTNVNDYRQYAYDRLNDPAVFDDLCRYLVRLFGDEGNDIGDASCLYELFSNAGFYTKGVKHDSYTLPEFRRAVLTYCREHFATHMHTNDILAIIDRIGDEGI